MMNVKFRMPKFSNFTKKSWLSELGMVFMGTTISMCLRLELLMSSNNTRRRRQAVRWPLW